MKSVPLVMLGVFGAFAVSWTGLVLSNQITYGALSPYIDKDNNIAYPQQLPGVAAQGKLVYQDLGCVACHTQQIRRSDIGEKDNEKQWGERPSVARDYLREERVVLGSLRAAPDLRNVGARKAEAGRSYDAEWHYRHLYDARLTSAGSNMPGYAFLFEMRKIIGQPSPNALNLPAPYTAPAGYEIVPTSRAEALVAYLMNLKDTFNYPEEASKVYVPKDEKSDKPANAEKAEPKKEK